MNDVNRILMGIAGILVILGIAFLLSSNKRAIRLRVVAAAFALQAGIAVLVLYTPWGRRAIEGMANGAELHPLQQTFADTGAAQCGYCSPGFLLVAEELLNKTPNPSRAEIQEAWSGNLCRCTGYLKIYEAVELAAVQIRNEDSSRTGAKAPRVTETLS